MWRLHPGYHRAVGRPTHVENLGTVICVGGGTGVAVMYPITKAYKEAGTMSSPSLGSNKRSPHPGR